jgi:hypothetical protein
VIHLYALSRAQDEGVHLLVSELVKCLEEANKRRAAADVVAAYAVSRKASPSELLEHVPQLLDVGVCAHVFRFVTRRSMALGCTLACVAVVIVAGYLVQLHDFLL